MIIIDKLTSKEYIVYGIYFIKELYFCVVPENYNGLHIYRSDQIKVVEHSLSGDFRFFVTDQSEFAIFHSSIDFDMLEGLFELDEEVFAKFQNRLDSR